MEGGFRVPTCFGVNPIMTSHALSSPHPSWKINPSFPPSPATGIYYIYIKHVVVSSALMAVCTLPLPAHILP
jgi:hypothetical protein